MGSAREVGITTTLSVASRSRRSSSPFDTHLQDTTRCLLRALAAPIYRNVSTQRNLSSSPVVNVRVLPCCHPRSHLPSVRAPSLETYPKVENGRADGQRVGSGAALLRPFRRFFVPRCTCGSCTTFRSQGSPAISGQGVSSHLVDEGIPDLQRHTGAVSSLEVEGPYGSVSGIASSCFIFRFRCTSSSLTRAPHGRKFPIFITAKPTSHPFGSTCLPANEHLAFSKRALRRHSRVDDDLPLLQPAPHARGNYHCSLC